MVSCWGRPCSPRVRDTGAPEPPGWGGGEHSQTLHPCSLGLQPTSTDLRGGGIKAKQIWDVDPTLSREIWLKKTSTVPGTMWALSSKSVCLFPAAGTKSTMCLALFKMHISIDFPVLDGFPAAESILKGMCCSHLGKVKPHHSMERRRQLPSRSTTSL